MEFERDTQLFESNALLFLSLDQLRTLDGEVAEVIAEAVRKDMALDEPEEVSDRGPAPRLPTEEALRSRYGLDDMKPYLESPDGEVVAVKAYPRFKPSDISRSRALMTWVDALIAEATASTQVETAVVGDYTGVSRSVNQLTRSLARSSGVALLLIVAVLSLYFRRLHAVLLVLVPLVAGLAWTTAFARAAVGQLNLISAFIFAILIGLGIDFAVHALSRVDVAVRAGHSRRDALLEALPRLGRSMGVAAITTIATFLSLLHFDFRGFSHFGGIVLHPIVYI